MLIHKQNIMLEAGIEVGLQAELSDNVVMMAVYMSIDSIKSLEDLSD